MSGPVWLQDEGLRRGGWYVERTTGLDDSVPLVLPTAIAGGVTVDAGVMGTLAPRRATLDLAWTGSLQSDLERALHLLRERVEAAPFDVRHLHRSGQRLWVRAQSFPVTPRKPQYLAPYLLRVSLQVQANQPNWEDITPLLYGVGSVPVALPMGTAPSPLRLGVTAGLASVVNPAFTYATAGGAPVCAVAPTITIAAGNRWQYDGYRGAVEKCVAGTWSSARDTVDLGTQFPILHPLHGEYSSAAYPLLSLSAGAGDVWWRRYWK